MSGINILGVIAIVVFYLLIVLAGVWAARRRKESEESTMIAGRSIGLFVGAFTMTATAVGGGYINGTAEVVCDFGLVWAQGQWTYVLALTVGGLAFAKIMREREYFSLLDPFQEKYGLRMGGLLYIPALFGDICWSGSILASLGATTSVVLNFDRVTSIIVSACIATFYTLIGGLYSVAYTDVIQVCCIFLGLYISLPFALTHEAVSSISEDSGAHWMGELPIESLGIWLDLGLLLVFGAIPWQAYFQRVLACKSPREAQFLSVTASFGCIVLAIPPILIGAIGASTDWKKTAFFQPSGNISTNQTVTFDKSLVLPMVLQYLTPTPVSFVGLGALSAAVMSSADSSILAASTMFARNIYKHVFRQKASEKEVLCVMRIAIFAVGAAATAMALLVDSIYSLWAMSADFVYVILFPQLCCVIYLQGTNTYGSFIGYVAGLVLRLGGGEPTLSLPPFIKYPYFDDETETQLFPFKTLSMLVSFVTIVIVSYSLRFLFKRKILPSKLDFLYCFREYELDKPVRKKNENYFIEMA